MILENVNYVDDKFNIRSGNLYIDCGHIYQKSPTYLQEDEKLLLPEDSLVLPGFIDIHTHGGNGVDACSEDEENFQKLSMYYASVGVTSFCPTTVTESRAKLKRIFQAGSRFYGRESGAYMHGFNLEGPFISVEKKGAQNEKYIRVPDIREFLMLNEICPISLVDLAPEAEGALYFSYKAQSFCTISAAHTACDYLQAQKAFRNGFSHVTHMFNAMNPIKAREPGLIPAAFEDESVSAELICDLFHVNAAVIDMCFRIMGEDRVVVISDSLSSAGCPDGEYMLGGQKVYVKDGCCRLKDGTIAGSTSNMLEEFKNLLDIGIDFSTALKACTINPARVVGAAGVTGSFGSGKRADLIVLDSDYNLIYTIVRGRIVYSNV